MRIPGFVASTRHSAGITIFFFALAVAAIAYGRGIAGGLHFDDPANLGGLTQVTNFASALRFVATGHAGPSGRPISLATFALQAYAWPSAPKVFLYTNICLHLLNGALVAWLLYLLSLARGSSISKAGWAASIAAALWMLSPLLASSSLLIVQRMTTLSAAFSLFGFIGYLYARRSLDERPRRSLALMSLSLVLGTGLSFFSKENGALLPVFILATEATLLPQPARIALGTAHWRIWRGVFLLTPAVALLVYLIHRLPYSPSVELMRGYTASQRLLTESRILWLYLYHAFLPVSSALGPFHDDQPVYSQWLQPLSALSVAGWILMVAAAVAARRRAPLFTFAVAWYLAGHALESTTIPLELYVEHRNYVPLIGPIYALVAFALSFAPKRQLIARGALVAYALVLAAVLINFTSLWGHQAVAAKIWAKYHPNSARATQDLVRQLVKGHDQPAALEEFKRYFARHPGSASMGLQALNLSCSLSPDAPHDQLLKKVRRSLQIPEFDNATFLSLRALYTMAETSKCNGIDRGTVYGLMQAAAANPAYQAKSLVLHNLNVLMSEEAFARRDLNLTMHYINSALAAHYSITTLSLAVTMLDSAGLYSDAKAFVQQANEHVPLNPLRAHVWRQQLSRLAAKIDDASHAKKQS